MPYSRFPTNEYSESSFQNRVRAIGPNERLSLHDTIEYLSHIIHDPKNWLDKNGLIWEHAGIQYCKIDEVHKRLDTLSKRISHRNSERKHKPILTDKF